MQPLPVLLAGPLTCQAWDDRFRRRAQPQPVSVRVRMTVDFMDAVRGVKKTVQVPGLGDAGGSKRLEVDIPAGACDALVAALRLAPHMLFWSDHIPELWHTA